MPWFRKTSSVPAPLKAPASEPSAGARDGGADKDKEEPEALNAFHLISLSEGFDLSPLFGVGSSRAGGILFATRGPASGVVSRLESLATGRGGASGNGMRVTKSGARGVRLEAASRGRSGTRLAVAAEIFSVAPSVLVVDVKKDGGDTAEYRLFCSEELRPALKDILWPASAPGGGHDAPGAT